MQRHAELGGVCIGPSYTVQCAKRHNDLRDCLHHHLAVQLCLILELVHDAPNDQGRHWHMAYGACMPVLKESSHPPAETPWW